jgi:hypothetical protein
VVNGLRPADQARARVAERAPVVAEQRRRAQEAERAAAAHEAGRRRDSYYADLCEGAPAAIDESVEKGEPSAVVRASVKEEDRYSSWPDALDMFRSKMAAMGYGTEIAHEYHSKAHYTADDGVHWPGSYSIGVRITW